jgi:hypothetical protein
MHNYRTTGKNKGKNKITKEPSQNEMKKHADRK